MVRAFLVKKLAPLRLTIENSVADIADVVCMAVDTAVRFFSSVFWAAKTIGAITILAFLLLALVLSGCAQTYYAHIWCHASKETSITVMSQDDGKLLVRIVGADNGCEYMKFENVRVEDK